MKDTFLAFAALMLFIGVSGMGCGVGGVSTHGRGGMIEELDPFTYGDELGASALKSRGVPSAGGDTVAVKAPVTPAKESLQPAVPATVRAPLDSSAALPGVSERPPGTIVYRVQIGVFEEQSSAKKLAADAQTKIEAKVYIEFEPPFYRVRIGDYPSRKDAEDQVKILRELGFRDSFWVTKRMNAQ